MIAINQTRQYNQGIAALIIIASFITLIYYIALSSTYFHATSKIEEGTIVQRNDSITTVIIPDKR